MQFYAQQPAMPPRRVKMPVQEPTNVATAPSASVPALAQFFKAARDTMDFGIDFTDWLIANGNTQATNIVYSEGDDSPQSPTIASQSFSKTGESAVLISGGAIGDAYYIDCTVTVDEVQVREDNPAAIGTRTIVRRIHVVVVAG